MKRPFFHCVCTAREANPHSALISIHGKVTFPPVKVHPLTPLSQQLAMEMEVTTHRQGVGGKLITENVGCE